MAKFSSLCAVLFLCSRVALTQTDQRIQRQDSVTVSAGIPREQLALEDKLNEIVSQGDLLLKNANAADAIARYQSAVDLVQHQPLLAEREPWVLKKLAGGYLQANRPNDAVPIYTKLLDTKKQDCESESAAVSNCADAQQDLGVAEMSASDLSGALVLLQKANSNYAKAEKVGNSHEFAMIQVKNQGEIKLLIGIALFRTGKSSDAIGNIETVIAELTRVQSDEGILVGIRDDAERLLRQAQDILARVKSAQ